MNKRETFTTPRGDQLLAEFRVGTNDRDTLTSCIVQDPYGYFKIFEDDIPSGEVIDLGAHIGGPSLALASLGFKVHAVEVLPENRSLLVVNSMLNDFQEKIEVYPNAIAQKSGEMILATYADTSTESGRVHEFMGNTTERDFQSIKHRRPFSVKTISLGDIIDRISFVPFIKSDCEAMEWECFKGLTDEQIDKIDWIALELHCGTIEDFLKMLHNRFEDLTEDFAEGIGHNFGHYILRRLQR